jgi:hypothetical protein
MHWIVSILLLAPVFSDHTQSTNELLESERLPSRTVISSHVFIDHRSSAVLITAEIHVTLKKLIVLNESNPRVFIPGWLSILIEGRRSSEYTPGYLKPKRSKRLVFMYNIVIKDFPEVF